MEFLIGIVIFLVLPIIVALIIISLNKVAEQLKKQQTGLGNDKLVCSIDADCPPGQICVDGKCVLHISW